MASKQKYYGIKFPFTYNNEEGIFIDLNGTPADKIASEILHVILTPVRTRLRMPDFGTNLAKYIFEPNDSSVWDDVKREAMDKVSRYVKNATLEEMDIYQDKNNEHNINLYLKYSVKNGNKTETSELGVKL